MNKLKFFLIAGVAIALTNCNGKADSKNNSSSDSTKTVQSAEYEASTNIRFVTLDSIYLNYELAKSISQQQQTTVNSLQAQQAQYQNQLQSIYNGIQQRVQSGALTQQQYESEMKSLEAKANSFQAQYAKSEEQAAKKFETLQKELKDSIDNFITIYNNEKKYDAILIRDAGLYFNPKLDITDEVVKGLNSRYKGAKVEGKTEAPANTPASTLTTPAKPGTLPTNDAKPAITVPGK